MQKTIRQIVAFALLFAMCFSFTACAEKEKPNPNLPEGSTKEKQKDTIQSVLEKEFDSSCLSAALALPSSSTELSYELAIQALALCSGHSKEKEAELFEKAGFALLAQNNYEKADDDPAHTSAYTVGSKTIEFSGEERTLVTIAVRGTNGGEWYSNFDFAPSKSDDAVFAENFLFTAEDAYLGVLSAVGSVKNPLFLVTGHSRGGATANLLALLLSAYYGNDNVFGYTFASPNTVKTSENIPSCENIFNFVNPCDIVTKVPFEDWGYGRVGIDILLFGDENEIEKLNDAVDVLFEIAPTVSSYYNDRHSLKEKGLADDGMTTFELMLFLAAYSSDTLSDEANISSSSSFSSAFSESDFAPLFELLSELSEKGGEKGISLLKNHMPTEYAELIEKQSQTR